MNKKVVTFTIAMVLLLGITMGVTFALFSDKTDSVTNTFVAGGFGDLTLEEAEPTTGVFVANEDDGYDFTVIPGMNIDKRPQISFEYADDTAPVDTYVFAKVVTGEYWDLSGTTYTSTDSIFDFSIDSDWTPVTGSAGVFYQLLNSGTGLEASDLFTVTDVGDGISYTIEVGADITVPTFSSTANITITAYAIQAGTFATAADAWAEASKLG